ncbi:hypothetical protein ACSBR2_038464 [Camellia fascicularis]
MLIEPLNFAEALFHYRVFFQVAVHSQDKFVIGDDFDNDEQAQQILDRKAYLPYKDWRYNLKQEFLELEAKGVDDPYSHPPSGVSLEDWKYLIDVAWKDKSHLKRSKAGKANRGMLPYNHTSGSRSFPIAMSLMDDMVNLQVVATDAGMPLTHKEISRQVLGEKKNYLRGCGIGPQPSSTASSAEKEECQRDHEELLKEKEERRRDHEELLKEKEERQRDREEIMRERAADQTEDWRFRDIGVEVGVGVRYVSVGETTKLIAYEYLGNHSLDSWLHGKKRQSISDSDHSFVLDWPKRLKIAVGAARGLYYMHHDCTPSVIHRDGKSSNILLDSQFNAKVADFGLAKILVKHGEPNTMSTVVGSFGYIAPECARTSRVNEKIDVYSFGVVLLELVTSKKVNDENEDLCLADWAFQYYNQEGNHIVDALDEKIKELHYLYEMTRVFELGIIFTGPLPSNRPSMRQVLQILLNCSRQSGFGGGNVGSENDCSSDFSDDFRQGSIFEGEDGSLFSIV